MKVDKGKWARVPLKSMIKEYSVRNKSLELSNVYSVTNSKGFVPASEYFDNTVQSSNLSTYKIVEEGMFAYNPSRINVGSIAIQDAENQVIVSPLYVIFSLGEELLGKYLLRYLKSEIGISQIRSKTSGSVRASLRFKDLGGITIFLPSLLEQETIASELDALQEVIDGYKAHIADLDALAQSIFLDMFGYVAFNDKMWSVKPLGDLGTLKNGLNFDKQEKGKKIKVIGVGDFKQLTILRNFEDIAPVELSSINTYYLLKDEDIIFVRSNGNKNLVGRCIEVYPGAEEISYSGFCIRFRKTVDIVNSYLIGVLSNQEYKKTHILKSNGIGIQNINQKLLSKLPIPIPPKELQQQFAMQIEAIEQQKEFLRQQLADAEMLMAERMQYYFS